MPISKRNNYLILLVYLSIILGFIINEDTLGGAFADYNTLDHVAYKFYDNFIKTLLNYDDLNFLNDSLEIIFFVRDGVSYEINIQTDNYGEENSWEILNNNNEIIAYENNLVSNQINTFNFCQDTDSCYTLFVFDEYEDGICCDFGNGYISVNNITYGGDFNSEIEIDLCATSAIDKLENINDILFYPNPTNGILIIKSLRNIEFLKIYDLRGKIVFQKYCDSKQENLNLHKLYKGSYIIQINTQEGTTTHKKIIIQ